MEEARQYLGHPILGTRLREISGTLLDLPEDGPVRVMGRPDDMNLCSCMTLFEYVAEPISVFRSILQKCYAGQRDILTLRMLWQAISGQGTVRTEQNLHGLNGTTQHEISATES